MGREVGRGAVRQGGWAALDHMAQGSAVPGLDQKRRRTKGSGSRVGGWFRGPR